MADKSWVKPGAQCWVWGLNPPRQATLVEPDGDDCWVFRYKDCGWLAGSCVDYIHRTELEAWLAWLEDELADLQILKDKLAGVLEAIESQKVSVETARERIAELESAPGAAGQQAGKEGAE